MSTKTWHKKYILLASILVTSLFIIQPNKEIASDMTLFLNEPATYCHSETQIVILVTSNAPNLKIRQAQRNAYPKFINNHKLCYFSDKFRIPKEMALVLLYFLSRVLGNFGNVEFQMFVAVFFRKAHF